MSIKLLVKQKIKEMPVDPVVGKREMAAAVHAIAVAKFGKEAVGDLDGYIRKPSGFWTLEKCLESAKPHKYPSDWREASNDAVTAAWRNGWYEQCIAGMTYKTNPANYWTLERCKESAAPYTNRAEWSKEEAGAFAAAYKNGWISEVCSHMTPSRLPLGHWNIKENCLNEAKKHKTLQEWVKSSPGSFNGSKKNGWYEECRAHFEVLSSPKWTKERCIESASQYSTRSQWQKNCSGAYCAASKNGWLEDCCSGMEQTKKPNGYWTKERCMESASHYTVRSQWEKGQPAAYKSAKSNGAFDSCVAHMKPLGSSLTLEACKADALKYKTMNQWKKSKSDPSYYTQAKNNNWISLCTGHFVEIKKPKGYWTIERCHESALKAKTKTEWNEIDSAAYARARQNGWIDSVCGHMTELVKPSGYWTKSRCISEAKKCRTTTEWGNNGNGSQDAASKYGWYAECVKHLRKD